ncbi:MAG: ThiF family adenylyltransferase [Gammaproteobacteria bacterium]|nr:ThiF family adenylyltransferase [Gammaproteobacteria bacterium]
MTIEYDYNEAFSRNIGWVTEQEQQTLRNKKIAIAGMGGVGGEHLITLSRMGFGNFHISDMDSYELANFNRQAGASLPTIGHEKAATMERLAKELNPEMNVKNFDKGVNDENLEEFLDGVDLYIDGLDFFVLGIRQKVFARCWEKGIPAITAAPLGMSTALINFIPGKMSFEEYFGMEGLSPNEQQIKFYIGLSPSMLHAPYLVDESRIDFHNKKGPSTPMACKLCAGVTATEAVKILLNRGKVMAAPWGLQFDAFRNIYKKTWRPGGNNNPIQKLMFKIAKKKILG